MKKRLSTAAMAAAICLSMGTNAFATAPTPGMGTDQDFSSNTADTEVRIQGMSDTDIAGNLSATVPLMVKLAVDGGGIVKGPTNYKIVNNTLTKDIKISQLDVTAESLYLTTGADDINKIDLREVNLHSSKSADGASDVKLNDITAAGHELTSSDWELSKASGVTSSENEVTVTFGGIIPNADKIETIDSAAVAAAGSKAFTLKYTIAVR